MRARFACALLACLFFSAARAQAPVLKVNLHGLSRTEPETVLALLPRPPPAAYSDIELDEFQRRLANLGIFDRVHVTRGQGVVEVELREKWTLIPMLDLSTGDSWRDTYLALSVTEYNFLGRAMQLTAAAWHQARGWNGSLSLLEHGYHAERGAFGGMLEYASAEYVFDDSPDAWAKLGGGASLFWQAPLPHRSRTAYQLGLVYRYEHIIAAQTQYRPPNGNQLQFETSITWENWHWSDFAPRGLRLKFTAAPGVFFNWHEVRPRIAAETIWLGGWAPTETTVLMAQFTGTIMSRGNANFSNLLGSYDGVRGLEDAVFHTWAQGVLNAEFRQALPLAARWALQGVVFADAAAFDRIDARGRRSGAGWAASAGIGARLLPTFLAEVVLRLDLGRSLWPEQAFFMQWGLSQYF